MQEKPLNDEEFLIFSLQHYENPQCESLEEFYEDLDRIKYLKRLMNRTDGDAEQKNRLILNHLMVLTNVFGIVPCCRILFFRMESKYHQKLKTYLKYLNVLAAQIPELDLTNIELDEELMNRLRNI
jgi:hypothetical protein